MKRASMFFVWMAMYCSGMPTTPLIDAARAGDTARIRELVAKGTSPNQHGGVNGWTALEHAVHKNQIRSVEALLDAGANPNATDPEGRTPLIMAAGYGYTPLFDKQDATVAVLKKALTR